MDKRMMQYFMGLLKRDNRRLDADRYDLRDSPIPQGVKSILRSGIEYRITRNNNMLDECKAIVNTL